MKKSNNITAFIILSITGFLCHFVYEFSFENPIVGLFAPINESTWEHLKLLFFPALIYFAIEYFIIGKHLKGYIPATTIGILSGMTAIVTLFYTYSGVIGKNYSIVDILLFFIGVLITILVKKVLIRNAAFDSKAADIVSVIILVVVAVAFILWTNNPPAINIFVSPV